MVTLGSGVGTGQGLRMQPVKRRSLGVQAFPLSLLPLAASGSVYMSMTLFHFIPTYPSPSSCPQVHSLRLRLYSCPAPRCFRTIFFLRFHIYVLAYGICFSISDLLHSV